MSDPSLKFRSRECFDFDWKFHLGDIPAAQHASYDDAAWRSLSLPHDWSIEQTPAQDAPGGGSHGWVAGGVGWYRKEFDLSAADIGRSVWIEFDGIYHNSDVWINGHHLGRRAYGFVSFHYDLTPHLNIPGRNVIAVRADNSDLPNCRWYTGSGIYRHAWLTKTAATHVAHWGTRITTPRVSADSADVRVKTSLFARDVDIAIELETILIDHSGDRVASHIQPASLKAGHEIDVDQSFVLPHPKFWSVESPSLYRAQSIVRANGRPVDDFVTTFGVRDAQFDKDRGLLLNGRAVKLKGICLHEDAGCLGVAVPDGVLERRLTILKELGCNAIRCSHNPPAPALLDFCDQMGFLVIDEAFDKWEGGFSKLPEWWMRQKDFKENWEIDLRSMLQRDRNHPCVILWSVGNETGQPGTDEVDPMLKQLVDFVRREEPSRPVTAALVNSNAPTVEERVQRMISSAKLVDVLCVNYQEPMYEHYRHAMPDAVICGSEVFRHWRGGELNIHSFEPINPWYDVAGRDWVIGQFLWAGFDYLGESNTWPMKGYPAGILDTCGFLKPDGWFHRSVWRDDPVVRIAILLDAPAAAWSWGAPTMAEHWNVSADPKQLIRVQTQTNCQTVELLLNGKSYGVRRSKDYINSAIVWHVPSAPGLIEAVARNGDKIVARHTLQTSGQAARIVLSADREQIHSDGHDVAHIEARLVDESGILVPDDDRIVTFTATSAGTIIGIDNGDMASAESYKGHSRTTLNGRCLLIVQSSREVGDISVTASSAGLPDTSLKIAWSG